MPRSFDVHRCPGNDLAAGLREALALYRQRHGGAPASVVVSADNVTQAREALAAQGLHTIPVMTSGGCLLWEVWMEVGGD